MAVVVAASYFPVVLWRGRDCHTALDDGFFAIDRASFLFDREASLLTHTRPWPVVAAAADPATSGMMAPCLKPVVVPHGAEESPPSEAGKIPIVDVPLFV